MKLKRKILFVLPVILIVSSCKWIENYDRRQKYLEAEIQPKVTIPEGLDEPPFVDALDIPDVIDSRGIAGQKLELDFPETISTSFGVEQIVIKRLGDTRWIFLDSPPASVWPKIRRFFEENNLEVERADPRMGILETTWIISPTGATKDVYESLVSGSGWADSTSTVRNKLLLTIEPGVRFGSSEVYVQHKQIPLGAPAESGSVNWTGDSDDEELENEVLTRLAYALGETINDPVFSIGATALRSQKAELVPDRLKPVLKYKLAFDRAWATVGNALENARIQVEDLDRSSQIYYIYFDEAIDRDPGFFSRVFFRNKVAAVDDQHRFLVRLDSQNDQVAVTVLKDSATPAEALLAERLLRIIKESST